MDKASTPAEQILPMIEQRIRDEVEPQVKLAREDMEHVIVLKLEQLGINPNLTSLYSFARGIADQYREQLVGKRIKAIVDGLVSEKPAKAESPAAPTNGCDPYGMPVKTAEAEVRNYGYTAAPCNAPIFTATMPPNLTQDQVDKLAARLKAQMPPDTQLVSLVGGVVLGRL